MLVADAAAMLSFMTLLCFPRYCCHYAIREEHHAWLAPWLSPAVEHLSGGGWWVRPLEGGGAILSFQGKKKEEGVFRFPGFDLGKEKKRRRS